MRYTRTVSIDPYTPPAAYRVPAHWPISDDERAFVTQTTWQKVLKGDTDIDDYMDFPGDESLLDAGVPEAEAEAFFAETLRLRREQQASWGPAPVSGLTRAFAELEQIGIIGRENFTCCGTCGAAEIYDERDDSRAWRGYLFYHSQDTDGILEDRETYVGYGAFLPTYFTQEEWEAKTEAEMDAEYLRIVRPLMDEAREVLAKHGIGFEWNGDLGTRIKLTNVDYIALI